MKTKFILHGGFKPGEEQKNDEFFREILNGAPQKSRILLIYFAKEDDRIKKNMEEDMHEFNKNNNGKRLTFELANEGDFVKQVKMADIIYLHGGHTGKLLEKIRKFEKLSSLLAGKIVAADSAGANILCSAFYSLKIGIDKGLGIIPVKIICHYNKENKDKLRNILPKMETLELPEYQFKVYNI